MIKKRSNRKALIRILEAFLAVLIVMGGVLFIMARNQTVPDIGDEVYNKQRQILGIIVNDDDLRNDIINGDNLNVNESISKLIPPIWAFSTNICGLDDICPNPTEIYDRDIYATEHMVSATLDNYAPKKLRFFVWMKD